jgi:hypothetical protein
MPLLETKGAAASQGFGFSSNSIGAPVYVEQVFSTYLHNGSSNQQAIQNGLALGDPAVSLVGKNIVSLGGAFSTTLPLSKINDGILETTTGTPNNAYVPSSNGSFDIYVDLTIPQVVTSYLIAPDGDLNSSTVNTPTAFVVQASNDTNTWTTVATFTSITTTYPSWNAGTFKPFLFTNTTPYRYWRLKNTTYGSESTGVAISEWQVTVNDGSAKGGMVWVKTRNAANAPVIFDTTRGVNNFLTTSATTAQNTSTTNSLISFNSNGVTFGIDSVSNAVNYNGNSYVSWAFQKQKKFFDVVTYTGNATEGYAINHNLGSVPGCIIVKDLTSGSNDWCVYHQSLGNTKAVYLNTTQTPITFDFWANTTPTSTQFYVANMSKVNTSGNQYIAYVFAHNAGGFGLTGTDNIITCGNFTADGSGNATVNLGYEPQWILTKRTSSATDWQIYDTVRGFTVDNISQQVLYSNLVNAEQTGYPYAVKSTGFSLTGVNAGDTFIYVAIRRGQMAIPTDATKLFVPVSPNTSTTFPTFASTFPVDMAIFRGARTTVNNWNNGSRLTGCSNYGATSGGLLRLNLTNAEVADTSVGFDSNTGALSYSGSGVMAYLFRRAPTFFDVVCYTGTGSAASTVPHGLGVIPELIISKNRSGSVSNWFVYHSGLTSGYYLTLTGTAQSNISGTSGGALSTSPTSTTFGFTAGTTNVNNVNTSLTTYIAYLFATCPGVSKVGSYTGTGATLTIACGFTGGARFVMIKRLDTTNDWYVWDTARGMVAGTDPYLFLDTSAIEVNANNVYTTAGGFQIVGTGAGINASGGAYIFLAIA